MSESLHDLLQKFHNVPDEDFNPEETIGSIKDKIDAIKWRIDKWTAEADALNTEWIKPLMARRDSMRAAAERLKDYVLNQMLLNEWEELPGNAFKARIQLNPPALKIDRTPSPQDFLQYPKYVRQDITYAWNKDTIKDEMKDGAQPIPGAELTRSKKVAFPPQKGVNK